MKQNDEIQTQKDDLKLSRDQFERSANSQERTAKLIAASELLKEYNEQIKSLEKIISEGEIKRNSQTSQDFAQRIRDIDKTPYKHHKQGELDKLFEKKAHILKDLEDLV